MEIAEDDSELGEQMQQDALETTKMPYKHFYGLMTLLDAIKNS